MAKKMPCGKDAPAKKGKGKSSDMPKGKGMMIMIGVEPKKSKKK